MPAILAFASVVAVSLVSLVGLAALAMGENRAQRVASFFVSFAAGALLGDAFIHLIPETFGQRRAPLLVLGGILLFFVVEKSLRGRRLATMNVVGDAIHNFIDGLVIGGSWMAGPELGITTTIAVVLHEIPQELGDFAILVHSGYTVRRALITNAACAAVAILGTATAVAAGAVARAEVAGVLIPITAGGFVYIAAADLIPELQRDRSVRALATQTPLIAAGIATMALLR
jgi:zinc and cadmium transporter